MTDKKICYLFPGQGVQSVGMLRDYFDKYEEFRSLFSDVKKWTDIDVEEIVYKPNELINKTKWTQLCILTVELGLLRVLDRLGVYPGIMAGYSLGEYACLVKSGVLSEENAIKLIVKRAEFMENACPSGIGGMAAVIGLEWKKIEKILADFDKVWIANYNTPSLVSISGEKQQVENASEKLKSAGARRVIPVNVSGPFHTPLLNDASINLSQALSDIQLADPKIEYYANYSAEIVKNTQDIKNLLSRQVSSPVKWSQTVSKIIQNGVRIFVEVGPGKTLRNFMRDEKDVELFGLETVADLDKLVQSV